MNIKNNNKLVSICEVADNARVSIETNQLIVEQNNNVKQRYMQISPKMLNYKSKSEMKEFSDGFKDSFKICGQIQSIGIIKSKKNSKYDVLFGNKRVIAAINSGLDLVAATEFISENEDYIKMIAIDESLIKVELTTLQRAVLLKQRKEIYERLYGSANTTKQSSLEGNKINEIISFDNKFISFSQDMATRTKQSQRSIQHDIQIAEGICDENKKLIEGTFLEDKKVMLLELSRLQDVELQAKVISSLLNHKVKNVSDALMQMQESFVMRPYPTRENRSEQLRINLRQQRYLVRTLEKKNKDLATENSRLRAEKIQLEEKLSRHTVPYLISMDESEYSDYSEEVKNASK